MSSKAPQWFQEWLSHAEGKVPAPPTGDESATVHPADVTHCLQLNHAIREFEAPEPKGMRNGLNSLGYSATEVVFGPMIGDTESEYGIALTESGAVFEFVYSYSESSSESGVFVQWEQIQGSGPSGEWEHDLQVVALCKEQLSA